MENLQDLIKELIKLSENNPEFTVPLMVSARNLSVISEAAYLTENNMIKLSSKKIKGSFESVIAELKNTNRSVHEVLNNMEVFSKSKGSITNKNIKAAAKSYVAKEMFNLSNHIDHNQNSKLSSSHIDLMNILFLSKF